MNAFALAKLDPQTMLARLEEQARRGKQIAATDFLRFDTDSNYCKPGVLCQVGDFEIRARYPDSPPPVQNPWCPWCEGRGEVHIGTAVVTCQKCWGTRKAPSPPQPMPSAQTCQRCDGQGSYCTGGFNDEEKCVPEVTSCPDCGGAGKAPPPDPEPHPDLHAYLMQHGILKNADAARMAREIEAMLKP